MCPIREHNIPIRPRAIALVKPRGPHHPVVATFATFAIEVSERGLVLRFDGTGLTIRAAGDLSRAAETVHLRAAEALNLHTGGDLRIQEEGDLHSSARARYIQAELGDVAIDASDDVRIGGERILVNC